MLKRPERHHAWYLIAADAVGVAHFLVANILTIIGEVTPAFAGLVQGSKHGGTKLVYEYLDAPVYQLVGRYVPVSKADVVTIFLQAELVFIASSILYGLVTFFILRVIKGVFS